VICWWCLSRLVGFTKMTDVERIAEPGEEILPASISNPQLGHCCGMASSSIVKTPQTSLGQSYYYESAGFPYAKGRFSLHGT
jgi:hypothetical protein